ncbi:antitoxin [Thermomonospora amylolytica]|uniref:antitoxin n=1 Tax=Thermomonospora amylolytica TaxID=1411117 RepID=UPI000E6BE89E|nr:antitoxin [Thermomonospora amylolytica]
MSIVSKVKQMLSQHPDQAKKGVEKAGDMFDRRTGGKYAEHVDKGQQRAGEYIDREGGGQRPPQTPPTTPPNA